MSKLPRFSRHIQNILDSQKEYGQPPFHCLYCGRFAHYTGRYTHYNGDINDIIVSWTCKRCGICEEGTQ